VHETHSRDPQLLQKGADRHVWHIAPIKTASVVACQRCILTINNRHRPRTMRNDHGGRELSETIFKSKNELRKFNEKLRKTLPEQSVLDDLICEGRANPSQFEGDKDFNLGGRELSFN
jgi:hypothetical protein